MGETPVISVSTVVLDGQAFETGLELLAMAGARSVEPAYIEGWPAAGFVDTKIGS